VPNWRPAGSIPIMARIIMKKPSQHAHQASYVHNEDQSIFCNLSPPIIMNINAF